MSRSLPFSPEHVPDLLAELTLLLVNDGRHREADSVLTAFTELRPHDPRGGLLAGLSDFSEACYGDAEGHYLRLLSAHPDCDLGRAFLAECLIAQRRWREAQAALDMVLDADRDVEAVRLANSLAAGLSSGLFQHATQIAAGS